MDFRLFAAPYTVEDLFDAVQRNDVNVVAEILNDDFIGSVDEVGATVLMKAVQGGNLGLVELLIAHGVNVNTPDIGGACAIHDASKGGYLPILKALVDAGADVNIVDNEGWSPLMRAISFGNKDAVEFLLSNSASVISQDRHGLTPLFYALERDDIEMLSLFNCVDFNGMSEVARGLILEYAEDVGRHSFILKLISGELCDEERFLSSDSTDDEISDGAKILDGMKYSINFGTFKEFEDAIRYRKAILEFWPDDLLDVNLSVVEVGLADDLIAYRVLSDDCPDTLLEKRILGNDYSNTLLEKLEKICNNYKHSTGNFCAVEERLEHSA